MNFNCSCPHKFTALFVAFVFGWNQILWAGEILPKDYVVPSTQLFATTPVTGTIQAITTPPVKTFTTTDFLSNEQGPLSPSTPAANDITHYDYERYDFQDALDLLRPEFSTAVIVKKITVEDLRKLAELPFETGVIVLHGEIVLFTSGGKSELGILSAASQLIKKATFVSHTHTGGSLVTGPSEFDLAHAGDQEYVITEEGVYAYDRTGLLNNGDVCSYGTYIEKLNWAVKNAMPEKDQVEARKDLNAFIADQDLYNASSDRKVFRSAEPPAVSGTTYSASAITALSSTPLASASLKTTLPGQSANGTNNFVQYDSTKFSFEYSLPVEPETVIDADSENDDFAVGQISWGYFNSSNVFVGSGANVGSPLVMALRADHVMRAKVEVVDTTGAKAQFWADLSTGYQNFSFDVSGLNESSIASVTVVSDVAHGGTSGKIYVITNGLSYTPVVAGTTYSASAITTLPWAPAATSSLGTTSAGQSANGTNNFVQYDSTKYSFQYSLPVEPETVIDADSENDDFAVGQISWGYFDSSNVFQGTAGNVGSPLLMALRADHVMRVKVEVVDTTGAKSQFWADLSTGYQNYSFDISALNESSIASVSVVSDVEHGGTAGKIYVITNALSYTPVVAGTVYNLANISRFFASPVVGSSHGTTVASDTATVTATQTSSTMFNVNSQVNVAGEYTTSTIGWGSFNSSNVFVGTGETLANTVMFALNGTAGKKLKVEFVNTSGVKKSFWVTPATTHQNYAFDITGLGTVGMINFVSSEVGTTAYTVETKGLAFTPPVQYFYDSAGNLIQKIVSTYYDNKKPATVDDYRYSNGLQTFLYQTTYDSAGLKTSYKSTTYHTDGKTVKIFTAYFFSAGVKTGYNQATFSAAGVKTQDSAVTYYPNGTTVKTSESRPFVNGVPTNYYQIQYDSSGLMIGSSSTAYYPDGRTVKSSQEDYYEVGVRTSKKSSSYTISGVKTQDWNVTYDSNGTTVKTIDDIRYGNNLRTYLYQTVNDFAGVKTHYIMTTYHPDGQTAKVVKDEYYAGAVRAGYNQATYSTTGVKTQDSAVTYYPNGTTMKTSESRPFVNGVPTNYYQIQYDPAGLKTGSTSTAYYSDGKTVKSFQEDFYENGVRTRKYCTDYNTAGLRTHLLIQVYYTDGKTKTSDDYDYTGSRLIKRILKEYSSAGIETSSLTENYPPQILTNTSGYAVRYTADGNSYEETISLTEGLNAVQKTVNGYNGTPVLIEWKITLDTVPPEILFTSPSVTNQKNYTLTYTADGIAKTKVFADLEEGVNALSIAEVDPSGNQTIANWNVTVDTIAPIGAITINGGALYTSSKEVALDLSGADTGSGVNQMRFTIDSGTTWTAWESFAATKGLTLAGADGDKVIQYQLRDQVGNLSQVYSDSIALKTIPVIQFTSATAVTNSEYLLTYTVNGTAQSERWQLSAGVNPILVRVPGDFSTFVRLDVTLNQPDMTLPAMPVLPTLPEGLISVTAQNGLIIKYDGSTIVSVENPGEYQLYLPQFDVNGTLTDGVFQFSNGDKLLYQNSKPVLKITSSGEKTLYGSTGIVNSVIEPDGSRIWFSYRVDDQGQVLSVLSRDASATSLYEGGIPSRILMQDGSDIRYEDGLLSSYRDATGNLYQYQIVELRSSGTITGYRSILSDVTPAGSASPIPFSAISADLSQYPAIQSTLGNKISTEIDYDANSKMTKFISGKGEVLTLHNQLPEYLTDSSGNLKLFESTVNSAGTLSSVALTQNSVPSQVFDASGNIRSIALSDGTVFQVTDHKLGAVTLSDGSVLTDLRWNASTQIMTDYVRTYTDGTKSIYANSHMVRKEEPNGNITSYIDLNGVDQPDLMTTADGRTYHFITFQNAQGLWDRKTELVKMTLSDGSRVEFENGKPVRYIKSEQVQLDPLSVPMLSSDRSYVASVILSNAELRSLTIDSAGTILSGEILFNDGTQYFIENGALVKQITADGKIVEVETTVPLSFEKSMPVKPEPLTPAEVDYRNELIDAQFRYFTDPLGIDADSGMPVDHYLSDTHQQSSYSQATLVGFWAEILATIARGDYAPSSLGRAQAFQKLESLLAELQKVQSQAGWNGMFSFFGISKQTQPVYDQSGNQTGTKLVVSYSRQFDNIGIGDNLNLSVSLASVVGALSGITLEDPTLSSQRDAIVTRIHSILSLQDAGYAKFYDTSANQFYSVRKFDSNGDSAFDSGHMDRVFNEFLPGLVWLAARNPSYKPALDNLDVTIRPYTTRDGTRIENAVPFDGGAFQMFWPLMHVDETKYPEFNVALSNFLYSQAEFVSQNGIPGLLSAGDDPGNGYNGKIGLTSASETDDPLSTSVGSLYGTAGAFLLAPHYTLQFLKNIEAKFPGVRTNSGLVDSIALRNGQAVYSKQAFGVDQASFILSLLGTSQNYFTQYLRQKGLEDQFDALYKGMSFNLAPAIAQNPPPPNFDLSTPALYSGIHQQPDGLANALTKRSSFIPMIVDPELGEGRIYDYLDPEGNFHHTEIEFGTGRDLKKMPLAQYLLLPGRGDMSRLLFSAVSLDLLNEATTQGAFYTPSYGYANSSLATDPIGEVRHIDFNLQRISSPVGLYATYNNRDLSQYDYISVPVRLGSNAPEGVSLKFEFAGMGEVFVTGALTRDWQYVQIPVSKPAGLLQKIAVVIQSPDGKAVSGDVYLGPLSAFKVRTSNQMDWQAMLGKSDSEIRSFLKSKISRQSTGGGVMEADEVLEDFKLDSDGKLVDGVLKRADGSIQYFRNGQLMKWVFRNGRTVLFEKGLATFILDLAQGKLQEGRFYYDSTFRGEIQSFVMQDNDSKKIYGSDGKLQTVVKNGWITHFKDGKIDSIALSESTLTRLVFAEDQSLLRAHVKMNDGREFDIDQGGEQAVVRPNGAKVYYKGSRIVGIETSQNGRTDFTYATNSSGQLTGVTASFHETVMDSLGHSSIALRTMSLFEYLLRPERSLEKQEILREPPQQILPIANIAGFSVGYLPSGEITNGQKFYQDGVPYGWYQFRYNSLSGPTLGMVAGNYTQPVSLGAYDFIQVTLEQDPGMTWNQDFNFVLKTPTRQTLYTFELNNAPNQYQSFGFSLAGKSGSEGEITLEVVREAGGVGKTGQVNIKDISYLAIKSLDHPLWENDVSINATELQGLKIEADTYTDIGVEIASHVPLSYDKLVPLLDMPSSVSYSDKDSTHLGQLTGFRRFDGAEVSVSGSDVTKVVLPDGTVNEYSQQGNVSQGTIKDGSGSGAAVGSLNYHYGELRKITQSDGKVYELSYEFDAQGDPITLIKDDLTGDVRRFKDGKLIESISSGGVSTTYEYQNGELIGAELFYKNRVLQSSSYQFIGDETQVTDAKGTTWYYDANGNLKKHLTKDGYLYAYSDYSATPQDLPEMPQDFKSANVFNATDLRAVSLIGYEAKDGMQVRQGDEGLVEILSPAGDKAVNVVLDDDRKIKSGQIQFANGLILRIENYLPVGGRLTDGILFSANFPTGNGKVTLLQDSTGAYTGSMFEKNGTYYSYDAYGFLTKISSPNGESQQFTYFLEASASDAYGVLNRQQVAFNGVPFPEEMTIQAGNDLVLSGVSGVLAKREGDTGFIISAYDDSLNQWKVLSGKFSSDGDRILMRNFLKNLKPGQYVAVAVKDPDFSRAGEDILALLEGIGSGQVRTASAGNQTWCLFGNEYLKKGEGREQAGGSSFSTVTEEKIFSVLAEGSNPVYNRMNMFLSVPKTAADAYASFLKAYEPNKPKGDLEEITVYSKENQIVYSESVNGVRTFYDKGKPRETYTSDGELLYTHEYGCPNGGCPDPNDPYLARVTLVKARLDFETESAKAHQQIEQVKFDALHQLAEQEEVAQAGIKQEVSNSIAVLDAYISQLQSQRYRSVKVCKSAFLGFGKKCHEEQYDVPGIAGMISEAQNQKVELLQNIQPGQIATIPTLIAQKKLEIEAATTQKMTDLAAQEASVLHDIYERETAPVLSDIYRRLLGRDPSKEEVSSEIARFGTIQAVDLNRTVTEIKSSNEFQSKTNDKAAIINQVQTFLNSYVATAHDPAARAALAQSLRLDPSEIVDLRQEEVTAIIGWLEARDLHFGQSAFLSLKSMLFSRGIDVPMVTLGVETVLVDILTGTINKFTEGDLVLSVFSFQRAAKIHGADITGVRYALSDLKALYQSVCGLLSVDCGLRMIAHVAGNHFVVITAVTAEGITYFETNQGHAGELVNGTYDQFMKVWDTGNGTGHLVVFKDQAITAKVIHDQTAMKLRGAFFPLVWLAWLAVASFVLSVASVVVSYISPTLGKILGYAAMVVGIVAIAASVVNFAVQGFSMALNSINSVGFLQSVQNGFTMLGNAIWEGVAHVGQFLKQGFTFLADAFTGNFSGLGAGITQIGKFSMDGVKVMLDSSGVLVKQNLTFGQMVGRSMISAAINIPVSKGLEGLGIDPRMARLAGAFVSGGVVGLGGGATGFLQSGVQAYLLQGVSEIGLKLDLPPPITAALSLAVNASLTGLFSSNFVLKEALPQIFPQFTQQLTLGGIELLGCSLALDPRITQLIGLTTAAAVGGVTRDLLNPNGMTSLWQSIQNAVLSREVAGGIVSIGAGFVVHELGLDQSLLGSLSSRLVAGAFSDFLASPKNFSLAASIIKSTDESFSEFFDPALLPQLLTAVMDHGLADGIEQYATMLFTRETINEFTSAGMSIGQWIQNSMSNAEDVVYNGQSLKRLRLLQNGKAINFFYVPKNDKLELSMIYEEYANGRRPRLIEFVTDEQGRITEAYVEEQAVDGTIHRDKLDANGMIKEVTFRDWNEETYAKLSFNSAGGLEFTNYTLGITDHLSEKGDFTFNFTAAPDFHDFDQLLFNYDTNLTPEQKSSLAMFTYGNGFWNQHVAPDATSPVMANFMGKMAQDQAMTGHPGIVLFDQNGNIALDSYGNVLTTASLPIGLYKETGLVGNILNWAANTWLGATFMRDSIEAQYRNYFDLIKLNQNRFGLDPNIPFVHFAHSGDFQPLIQALEHMPDPYREKITTVVAYGTPYIGDGIINDPFLKTLIRVKGEYDAVPFQELGQKFQIEDANGNVRPVENQYNIEILKAGHSDFSCASGPSGNACSDFVNQQTSMFMRDLNLAANDKADLEYLLTSNLIPGVRYDSVNKLVIVNPNEYVSPNGAR
ncbi:MAG: interleukin-like EMT inducer domain-containing protein [Candidatus Omnitrophota bacterium]